MAVKKFTCDIMVEGKISKRNGSSSEFLMADGSTTVATTGSIAVSIFYAASWSLNSKGMISQSGINSNSYILSIQAMLECNTPHNGYITGDCVSILNGQYPVDAGRTASQGISTSFKESSSSYVFYYSVAQALNIGFGPTISNVGQASVNPDLWRLKFVVIHQNFYLQ